MPEPVGVCSNELLTMEIALSCFEVIAVRGVRRVAWYVAEQERWVPVASSSGARVENHDSCPGVVWRRQVFLNIAPGTKLMRIESQPDKGGPSDPLAYLWKQDRGAKQNVRRSYFRVGKAGRLEPVEDSSPSS
jgi:hypothetical protein